MDTAMFRPAETTEYTYDGLGRLTGETRRGTGTALTESYRYDRAGNRTALERSDGTRETYAYGALNELLTVQCTGRGRSAEGDRRPKDTETIHFSYDTDGNLTGDGRGLYRYDGFGQMTEAVMEDGSTLVCRYDAGGLRHETEENGRLVRFIYSGRDAVCEEREEGGSIRYIREHGRLAASDCEQARTYYHYACDSLGSVLYVLAGNEYESPKNGGTLQERALCSYTYDAFGRERSAAEQTENRYRYTGEQYDAITGQYYLRARYYRPETGRFTQMDPYHGDGLNLYVYAGNNPVRYVDPSGHEKEEGCKDNGMGGTDGSESGRGTRIFTSKDPLVGDVATQIEQRLPGRVTSVNKVVYRPDGSILTDLDIELDNIVIQVKAGGGKGLTKQLVNSANNTGKIAIGYVPDIKPSVLKEANKKGFQVFKNTEDLIEFISQH